jgi:uncharacterized protein YkwD
MSLTASPRMAIARVTALLALMAIFGGSSDAGEIKPYRVYVEKLMSHPPDGVVFRDDLETYLSRLASNYRKSRHRRGLLIDPALRDAARAQAIDMMLEGRSTHFSRSGDGFKTRFDAFLSADNTAWVSGENAASNRQRGPVDQARAKALFGQWLKSTGHRRNLLNDRYVYVSTGAVQRGEEFWSVQIFWSEPIKTNLMVQ